MRVRSTRNMRVRVCHAHMTNREVRTCLVFDLPFRTFEKLGQVDTLLLLVLLSLVVSIRRNSSAYVSIRQHTSAYVSMLLFILLNLVCLSCHMARLFLSTFCQIGGRSSHRVGLFCHIVGLFCHIVVLVLLSLYV